MIKVQDYSSKAFKKQISEYVDGRQKRDELSPWPLVRVCRIRHNWGVSPINPHYYDTMLPFYVPPLC